MNGVFVTAIGTDCGKTHVSAALLRELARRGRPALALKPLMSGFSPEKLEESDAGRLMLAMGRPVTWDTHWAKCTNQSLRSAILLLLYISRLAAGAFRIIARSPPHRRRKQIAAERSGRTSRSSD